MKKIYGTLIFCILISLLCCNTFSYKAELYKVVHQHITNQSYYLLIPEYQEIYDYIGSNLYVSPDDDKFDKDVDTIISGSSEEDYAINPSRHFWKADVPNNGKYDDGLLIFPSSFDSAKEYFEHNVIDNYIKGKKSEAYYYLGRMAHLLEDTTVPSHMLLDNHPGDYLLRKYGFVEGRTPSSQEYYDDSVLEEYTGINFWKYRASNVEGEIYNYENLIENFSYSDWLEINPNIEKPSYPSELFKLFWYTAQKTQYFASDDVDGNSVYRKSGNNDLFQLPNLWANENVTIINSSLELQQDDYYYSAYKIDSTCIYVASEYCEDAGLGEACWYCDVNDGQKVKAQSDALIPHAMKATAGLYKLFWDTVHSYSWETFHHNNQREGWTLLKGDIKQNKIDEDTIDETTPASDTFTSATIVNVDNDETMELLYGTSGFEYSNTSQSMTDGRVFLLEMTNDCVSKGKKNGKNDCFGFADKEFKIKDGFIIKKDFNFSSIRSPPQAYNLDVEGNKEIIVASYNGVYIFKSDGSLASDDAIFPTLTSSSGTKGVPCYSTSTDQCIRRQIYHTTIADLNSDGDLEIIVGVQGMNSPVAPATIYILSYENDVLDLDDNYSMNIRYLTHNNEKTIIGENFAVANLDGDDFLELVVNTGAGVFIYDGENLAYEDHEMIGNVIGSPTIADVDMNNDYEILVNTISYGAACTSIDCYNRTYVLHIDDNANFIDSEYYPHSNYPTDSVAIGNIDKSDKYKEIVVTTYDDYVVNETSEGEIILMDYNADHIANYTTAKGIFSSPIVVDIDNDGEYNVVATDVNGTMYILDEDMDLNWSLNVGGIGWSSAVIGDLDNDRTAEIVVRNVKDTGQSALAIGGIGIYYDAERSAFVLENINAMKVFATQSSTVTVYSGNNTKPIIHDIETIYALENDTVKINISYDEFDNDSIEVSFGYPLNSSGEWKTTYGDAGFYEAVIEVSDGNLTDSKLIPINVYENGTSLITNFSDNSSMKNLTSGEYIHFTDDEINWYAQVHEAFFRLYGFGTDANETSYQHNTSEIIVINNGTNNSYVNDNNFSTWYSAGDQTGAILELQNNEILNNVSHIILHLKIELHDEGTGRLGIYNYNAEVYEIATNSIPATNNTANIYLDVYENTPLWITNDTHYTLKAEDIDDYINTTNIRWYFKYLGDFENQKIYDSEVKVKQEQSYPENIKVIYNNSVIYNVTAKLMEDTFQKSTFENSQNSIIVELGNNDSNTTYLTIPKEATILSAVMTVGEDIEVNDNATAFEYEDYIEISHMVVDIDEMYTAANDCNGSITELSFAPNENYPLEVCVVYASNNSVVNCTNYTNSTYGVGNYFSLENYSLNENISYKLRLNWTRIKYENGTNDGKYDHNATDNLPIIPYKCYEKDWGEWEGCNGDSGYNFSTTFLAVHPEPDQDCDGTGYMHYEFYNSSPGTCRIYEGDIDYGDVNASLVGATCLFWAYALNDGYWTKYDETCQHDTVNEDISLKNAATGCNDGTAPSCPDGIYDYADSDGYVYSSNFTYDLFDTNNINVTDKIQTRGNLRMFCKPQTRNDTHFCNDFGEIEEISAIMYIGDEYVEKLNDLDNEDMDFTLELNNALTDCTKQSDGNCLLPVKLETQYDVNVTLKNLNIEFDIDTFDFKDELQTDAQELGLKDIGLNVSLKIEYNNSDLEMSYVHLIWQDTEPDLKITDIESVYVGNTNVTVNFTIQNNGSKPIFNVSWQFDTKDNYNATGLISELYPNNTTTISVTHNFSSPDIYNVTVNVSSGNVTAKLSEEIYVGDLVITEISELYSNGPHKVFEFVLKGQSDVRNLTNINWSFTTDSTTIYSDYLDTLSIDEEMSVITEFWYSTEGDIVLQANGYSDSNSFERNTTITVDSPLQVNSIEELYAYKKKRVFEIEVENLAIWNRNITNVTLTFNTGTENITFDATNITTNTTELYYVEYEFNNIRNYTVSAIASNGTHEGTLSSTVEIYPPLQINDFKSLYNDGTYNVFSFDIYNRNNWNTSLTGINWTLDTGESNITSQYLESLTVNETATYFIEYNYSTAGTYEANLTVFNGTYTTSEVLEVS